MTKQCGTRTGCYQAVLAEEKEPEDVKNMMRDRAYEFTKRQVISEAVLEGVIYIKLVQQTVIKQCGSFAKE